MKISLHHCLLSLFVTGLIGCGQDLDIAIPENADELVAALKAEPNSPNASINAIDAFVKANDSTEKIPKNKAYRNQLSTVSAMVEIGEGRVASGDREGVVHIWDIADPTITIGTYTGHTAKVSSLLFLSDGRIASASRDASIQIWNPDTPEVTDVVYKPSEKFHSIYSMLELADGRIVSMFDGESAIRIWHPDNPETTEVLYKGHAWSAKNMVLLATGNILSISFSGSSESAQIWNPDTLEASFKGDIESTGEPSLLLLNDGRVIVAGSIWDPMRPNDERIRFEKQLPGTSIVQLADGRVVFAGNIGTGNRLNIGSTSNLKKFDHRKVKGLISVVLPLSGGGLISASKAYKEQQLIQIWDADEL